LKRRDINFDNLKKTKISINFFLKYKFLAFIINGQEISNVNLEVYESQSYNLEVFIDTTLSKFTYVHFTITLESTEINSYLILNETSDTNCKLGLSRSFNYTFSQFSIFQVEKSQIKSRYIYGLYPRALCSLSSYNLTLSVFNSTGLVIPKLVDYFETRNIYFSSKYLVFSCL
jgi:hypothetical protein